MNRSRGLRNVAYKTLALSLLSGFTGLSGCKTQPAGTAAKEAAAPSTSTKAGAVSEADMGALVQLRNDFLAVNSRADLDAFLTKLAGSYQTAPTEVKFVAAQLLLLRPLKGIVYRATPLLASVNATHSVLLTAVQQAASTVNIFLPTAQWQAVFAYVSEPDGADTPQFKTIEDVQNDAETNVQPLLVQAIKDIEALDITDAKPIVWDHKFFYGTGTFKDGRDRFVKVGLAEKLQALASLHRSLLGLRLGCAYNLNDALQVSQNVGKIFGVDGYLLQSVQGAPMAVRVKAVQDFKDFGTLRAGSGAGAQLGNGKALLTAALANLQAAAKAGSDQYAAVQARANALGSQVDEYWGINPAAVMAFQRVASLTVQEASAIAAGPASVSSMVTGETVNVNLPAFFTQPPADLKVFLPTAFVTDATHQVQGLSLRNYQWGSPTAWNAQAYAPYLPSVQKPGDVAAVARVLSESHGGGGVLGALSTFVN